MTRTTIAVVVALALGSLTGCERSSQERSTAAAPAPQAGTGATQSNTPSTPANIGQPQSQAEKKDGANPVQGQVDPKQGEQHKDFQQRGDGAGPRGPDTQPKTGG
jgi:curli biogenesis system outer membrane secretion channel CsgG